MSISDRLAKQALEKIQEQDAVIADLRKRLGITDDLGSAIQKSLQRPSVGSGRNRLLTDILRPALFAGEKPVSKAARQQSEADRKAQLRRELQKAKGLRPKDN